MHVVNDFADSGADAGGLVLDDDFAVGIKLRNFTTEDAEFGCPWRDSSTEFHGGEISKLANFVGDRFFLFIFIIIKIWAFSKTRKIIEETGTTR